jgi:hypothetical protein
MPLLREGVPGHGGHCIQGRIGFSYGQQRISLFSRDANVTLVVD